jgi:hypothetical protein
MPHITSAGTSPHQMASAGGNGHAGGVIVLALLVIIIAAAGVMAISPRSRRRLPRFTAAAVGGLLAVYAVGRGIVEFFLIHYSQPESYRDDWGGPSLAGVLAVHSGPGLAILIIAGVYLHRWRRARRRKAGAASAPAGSETVKHRVPG